MSSNIANLIPGCSVNQIENAQEQNGLSNSLVELYNKIVKTSDDTTLAIVDPNAIIRNVDLDTPGAFIKIPNGEFKFASRVDLKRLGNNGEFILFPNFPGELRLKVYELSLPEFHEDRITFVETATKKRNGVKRTKNVRELKARPALPALIQAIKEARNIFYPQDLAVLKSGFVIAKSGVSMFQNVKIIDAVSAPGDVSERKPKLILAEMLKSGANIAEIKFLEIDVSNLVNGYEWVLTNLAGMSGLEKLHILATVGCPADRGDRPFSLRATFRDARGDRREFKPSCKFPVFGELRGYRAMRQLVQLAQYQPEEQSVMDLWMGLNRRLRSKVPFPSTVEVTFRFVPNTIIDYSVTATE